MKQKRRSAKLRVLAVLLILCQVFSCMPIKSAEAASPQNFIAPENSSGIIHNKGFRLSAYNYYEDGSLTIKNTYHYEPGHVTTYYTINTIWSKVHSRDAGKEGYPTQSGVYNADWVYSGVSASNEEVRPGQVVSFSNFNYSQEQIRSMLEKLFGELQPDVEYTIYMSPVYVLRERFADGTYVQDNSVKYYNLDDIRGAAGWTQKTKNQFPAYYDIPMTFKMRGGQIWIVCVDMDNGNSVISTRDEKYVFGDTVKVVPTPQLVVDGETLNYANKWNWTFSFLVPPLTNTGNPTEFEMKQELTGRRVYLGYSRTAPTPMPELTPGATPTNTPTPTPTNTPTPTPTNTPTPVPGVTATPTARVFEEIVRKEGQTVQVYADDYNSSTGALTDVQPYLVEAVGGAPGSIPSTEQAAIRAKAPGWEYDIKIREVTGKKESTRTILVPYSISYLYDYPVQVLNPNYPGDDPDNPEPMYIWDTATGTGYSTGTRTVVIKADKNYSYWVVDSVDTYKADKVQVSNASFESNQELSVDWSVSGAPTVPIPQITTSHEVKTQTKSAITTSTYTASFGYYIDWTAVNSNINSLANGYRNDIPELLVKSDKLVIDGELILDNTQKEKNACEPSSGAVANVKSKIKDTIYPQTYKSGVDLKNEAVNGYYATNARYTYTKVGGGATKTPAASEMRVNNVRVHTPVVCDGIVTVDGTEYGRHDSGDFQRGITVDFPLNAVYNPFTIEVSNYGTHNYYLGYGERDYVNAKSGDKNIAVNSGGSLLNEVKFPFDVYYDVNGDSFDADGNLVSYADDCYFAAGSWICVGSTKPQFYVLGSLTPGVYSVEYRTTATNCPKDASGNYAVSGKMQNNANTTESKYAATDLIKLNVYEDFMGFELNGTNDPVALEDFNNGQRMLTLDKGYYFNFYSETIGDSFNSNSMRLLITPTYSFISEDGKIRTDAELYYHENINGKSEYYVSVGSAKDNLNVHTYTNRDELPGIDNDLLSHTESVLGSKMTGNKTDMFVFGNYINSDRWFRMCPPITDPMPNKYCTECYKVYSETEARPCSHVSTPGTIFTMASVADLVQNWYAGFYLPADTFCVTSDTREGYCDACGETRYVTEGRTTCPDHGTALKVAAGGANGTVPFSFNTYAANHTLTGEEEFFRKDGYVAINFDIMAIDSANAFVRQYNDFEKTEIAKQWKESGFPYQTGDVILYRLNKSIRDAYEIGGSE